MENDMKRSALFLLVVFFSAALFAQAELTFKNCFPSFKGWENNYSESNMEMFLAKGNYLYKDGMKKILVGIQLGPDISETSPGNVPAMNMNGVVMATKRIQGYAALYTYTGPSREGRVMIYMPADKRQKYNGTVTFSAKNMSRYQMDAIIKKFNLKKIKKRMEDKK